MKKVTLFWLLGAAAALTLIAACGKSGGGGGGEPVVSGPQIVVPTNVRMGFFAQNDTMTQYGWQNTGVNNVESIYNLHPGMVSVLKTAMRTCDRQKYSGGLVTCESFLSGMNDIMIYMNGSTVNQVQMVIRSQSVQSMTGFNYWYSLPSFEQMILGYFGFPSGSGACKIYNPMVLTMTVWPINNSQGFELRGNAPGQDYCYNSGALLFQFQVPVGKFEDLAWDYKLIFNGAEAASGRMVRCPTANCGVQGF